MLRRRRVRKIDELLDELQEEAIREPEQAEVNDVGAEVPPEVGRGRRVAPPPGA